MKTSALLMASDSGIGSVILGLKTGQYNGEGGGLGCSEDDGIAFLQVNMSLQE